MNSVTVLVKKLDPEAKMPTKATPGSAGYDLYALEDTVVNGHAIVRTGLAMDIPEGYVGKLFARSGNAFKYKLTLSNSTGIIDSDYRQEIKILITDLRQGEHEPHTYLKGDKIAQIIVEENPTVYFQEVKKLSETERDGGFGSSGR